MEIILTQAQFAELKKLVQIVKEGQAHNTTGEATNASNVVEWSATEIKFTLS